ncbi:MAG: deoxyhypusine synthase family protein [Phycisphaerales bacterium]|nr:deoxyhypusine synthase family protein [Phycisphaerales bacterium]
MPTHEEHDKSRGNDRLSDGWSHQFKPLNPIDVTQTATASELLAAMSRTAFSGRSLGEAADILVEMAKDPDCFVVLTLSGAMTIAKQGLLITEMIDQGLVHAVVSTGALMCHGLIEQSGHTHFRHDPHWSDEQLYDAGYCRVYDTLELEANLEEAAVIMQHVLEQLPPGTPVGSHELNWRIGDYVRQQHQGRGILQSAAAKQVPVYVPGFTDSELGLDVYVHNQIAAEHGRPPVQIDLLRDIHDYYARCCAAKRLGIVTIGGGVPRNWAQQVGPLGEILDRRTAGKFGAFLRFQYAIRICPEPVHWGGLSGCTYSEGVSWGKFVSEKEGGRHAEVYADATLVWPLLLRGVLERLGRV